jgi:hypothetical protein
VEISADAVAAAEIVLAAEIALVIAVALAASAAKPGSVVKGSAAAPAVAAQAVLAEVKEQHPQTNMPWATSMLGNRIRDPVAPHGVETGEITIATGGQVDQNRIYHLGAST